MSKIAREALFARTIDLIIDEGDHIEQWAARLVTIHAGLAAAVGLVVSWRGLPLGPLVSSVVVVFASLAIALSVLINGVVARHLAWQSGYVESAKLIEGTDPLVFRDAMLTNAPSMGVSTFFGRLTIALCIGWGLILSAGVFMLVTGR